MRELVKEEVLHDFSITLSAFPSPSLCSNLAYLTPASTGAFPRQMTPELTHRRCSCRTSGKAVKCSAFCLSLISPELRTMVCGSFRESTEKQILLDNVDEGALGHGMDLACGRPEGVRVADLREMMGVGAFAHRYQMAEVVGAVEEVIVRSLTVDICGEVLRWAGEASDGGLLPGADSAARKLGLDRFAELSRSQGFDGFGENVLCGLVGNDDMAADEDVLLGGVVRWVKGGDEEGRGERVLRKIRYGLMEASRLGHLILKGEEMLAGRQGAMLRELASEAMAVQHAPASVREGREYRLLCSRAFSRRRGQGVAWGEYEEGRRQHQVVRDEQDVTGLCESDGLVYGGLGSGSVAV